MLEASPWDDLFLLSEAQMRRIEPYSFVARDCEG
jgi:hypothetical protein